MENGNDSIARFDAPNLEVYVTRIIDVPRARQLRWIHTQAEDQNSPLYTDTDIRDLLDRVRECFNGPPED